MATALPTIETDLDTHLTSAVWVMNAYLLAFGVSIATGGWIADRVGRRRTLIWGLLFTVELVVGGLATAVASSVVGSATDIEAAIRPVFIALAVLAGAGALLALRLSPAGEQVSRRRSTRR
ncbi:MAG: hypothetical protein QOI10_1813 [Solirubrobacterales bacterium]|jgi:MFS family permease|nr:hypothetical protein [Solirubrobacterales bacterium]